MDDYSNGDAWFNARVGNAIDALVDRTLNRPQFHSDAGQAYGVDANGNLYQLGQTNSQIVAQVTAQRPAAGLPLWLILAGVALLVVLEKK